MKNFTTTASIALLFFATGVAAQEVDEPSGEADAITAEVFASDIVAPDQQQEGAPVHEMPTLDQVVPVADDESEEIVEQPAANQTEDFSSPAQASVSLAVDATDEERLLWHYTRYLELMKNGVYDEADSAA